VSGASSEAACEREGVYAASRGRNWQSNPYLRREQMPVATGESLVAWVRKHDAWQRGFESVADSAGDGRRDGANGKPLIRTGRA